MNLFYHIGLYLYKFLIVLFSAFNTKAKKWLSGRKGLLDLMKKQLAQGEKRVWVHASSLGEFEQGRPIIEKLKKELPEYKIVLTFFSPSGYEIQKDYEHADYVFYLPLDTTSNAKKFVDIVQPEFAIFIKYEFWRNFLKALSNANIATYLVSAIFIKEQIFFQWYGKWYRKMLKAFEHFFVQNTESKKLLQSLDYKNATISGDTRFDRVYEIAQNAKPFPIVEKFTQNKFTIILGSSWKADEEILFDYINEKAGEIKFIIAPHEIHESNIQRVVSNLTKKALRYSQASEKNVKDADILVIDNIGILSSIYQYGYIAYIGGGFGDGIHNIQEPTTFGLPVLFGPNYKKFHEAVELIGLGGAFEIKSKEELEERLQQLYVDNDFYTTAQQVCSGYVNSQRGASEKIIGFLLKKYKKQFTKI